MLEPDRIERATRLLDDRFGLDALWLFGSFATGAVTAESDVDLAALLHRSPGIIEWMDTQEEVGQLLGHRVDLVDLRRASPILALQVLRHGRLLVDRHPGCRQRFVAGVPGRYEDLKIIRRAAERGLLERVRRGRS